MNEEQQQKAEKCWKKEMNITKIGSKYDLEKSCYMAGFRDGLKHRQELSIPQKSDIMVKVMQKYGRNSITPVVIEILALYECEMLKD